ncbi:MAG TPA: DUF427 domain-containing protein [Egibacteraceae bacterium]|nr:DUF427 domain-containing protein [Egibacteraceae bacterium]
MFSIVYDGPGLETGLPPRFYLPDNDVPMEWLEPSHPETSCPYEGTTRRYYAVEVDGEQWERPHTSFA